MTVRNDDRSPLRSPLRSQSGNVFFALFGAVALVGVVGATTMGIMKGPIKTMANINRQTMAETNMMAGMQVGMVAATTQQSDDGDCDADTFVEPLPFRDGVTDPHPTGGGYIPNQVGVTKQDPWRTEYGYCVWDHGAQIDDAGCGGATQKRLQGTNSTAFPALAIISAGPNRTFETICRTAAEADSSANGGNDSGALDTDEKLVYKPSGSDDILISYSYAEAAGSTGGLWTLKSGDPGTAEINKSIEFSGGLKMGTSEGTGGSVLDAVCTGPTDVGVMRFDPFASGGTGGIEVCDLSGGLYGWQPISSGGGAADSLVQDDGSETCTATDADADGTPDDTGKVRYNTASAKYEVCDGSVPGWREIIVGSTAATLVVSPDTVTIDIDGTGQTTSPRYSHTAAPYVEVTVKNTGSAAMAAAFVAGDFVWGSNGNFEVVTNNCTGVTLTESGGAQDSCTLELRAYAYTDGSYSATLKVNQNNAPVLSLEGTSTDTCSGVGQPMGGGIKVACYDTYDLIAMPAGCADQAAVNTATECTGADWMTKQWSTTRDTYVGATSPDDSAFNISRMLSFVTPDHPAAEYCNDLITDATYDDWYLPSYYELSVLYGVKDLVGGFAAAFYWTSREINYYSAYTRSFGTGAGSPLYKDNNYYIRCVRRHSGGSSAPAPEPVTKPGYLVLTKNTYQGNLTQYNSQTVGTSAADEICLNELLNNQWMGRENTVLNSTTVKAFLAVSSSYKLNVIPSTRYYFAAAGQPTVGGAYLDTDADARGPGNNINWAAENYFGTPATYWTGSYQGSSDTETKWPLTGIANASGNCNSWKSTSYTASYGSAIATDKRRWLASTDSCSNEKHLICIVNPSSEAATAPAADPGSAGTGFFVLSKNTYDGNLGGQSGADALCLSDLTSSQWKGRDNVALNGSTVRAMFISTKTLMPNTRYYFAKGGDAYAGGAYFDTYENGLGPYDSNPWSGRTYFDGAATYWGTYGSGGSSINWPSTVELTYPQDCSNYTSDVSSTEQGRIGDSTQPDAERWYSITATCDTQRHLVCVVHPSGDEVTPPPPDPIDNGPGYFVLTKNQYNGNLGGVAGANAICLSEMTNNNWRGRDNVTLNSSTVRAFLCATYTNCQNPLPNQRYYFAVAGNATAGGAWFDADSTGAGPGNAYNWSGSNYFAGAREYWTGPRKAGTNTLFDLDKSAQSYMCGSGVSQEWTYSDSTHGAASGVGTANATGAARWRGSTFTCDQLKNLICIVDPAPEDDPTPPPADPLDAGPGYFVMTSESYTGDLVTEAANRGLSGSGLDAANALCLKDLTDHDWYGRSGATLNSATVRAFLCGNTCNTLLPMQRYYFARSNNTAVNSSGFGWFDTGSTGLGPNDSAIWSDLNHFGGVVNYWSGRGGTGDTSTYWGSAQASFSASCSVWSNATLFRGGYGSTGSTDMGRWRAAANEDCSIPRPLICIVDPSSDAATAPPPAAPDYVCNSSGFCGTYSVNAGTKVRIKLWGGGGGGGGDTGTYDGGAGGGGGYSEFITTPSVDTTYHIYVGGGGQAGTDVNYTNVAGGSSYAGYTGGAGGFFRSYATGGGGGGGATLVFDGDPSVSGVLVALAAGGGGGGGGKGGMPGNSGIAGGSGPFSTTQMAGETGRNPSLGYRAGGGGGGAGWTGSGMAGGGTGGAYGTDVAPAGGGKGGSNYTVSGAVAAGSGQDPSNIDDVYYQSPRGKGGNNGVSGTGGLALIYFGENAE